MKNKNRTLWDQHYQRQKSIQKYPDENLVRILSKIPPGAVLDYGCGSGRHLKLLHEMGFAPIYGYDNSINSRVICKNQFPVSKYPEIQLLSEDDLFSLGENHFNLIILWGVLHYNDNRKQQQILNHCQKLLKETGILTGTYRSSADSHFSSSPDMQGGSIQTLTETQVVDLLSGCFQNIETGYQERIPVGETKKVCHWIFKARKKQVCK